MWKKYKLQSAMVKAGDIDICRVKIDGYLDSSTFPKLQDYLSDQLEKEQYNYLLDFEDLDYISSAGLGVLMGMLRQVRQNNGDIKIVNMSEKIQRVFDLLGFSRLVETYKNEELALEQFEKGEVSEEITEGENEKAEEEY
jgi:anti-sigma B factor antagonist